MNDADFATDVLATLAGMGEESAPFLPFLRLMVSAHQALIDAVPPLDDRLIDGKIDLTSTKYQRIIARAMIWKGLDTTYHQLMDVLVTAVGNATHILPQMQAVFDEACITVSCANVTALKPPESPGLNDLVNVYMRAIIVMCQVQNDAFDVMMHETPNA